jgi:hypothetical protein
MTRRPGHARRRHAHGFGELTIREKQARQLASWRPLELVRCAACGTAVSRDDIQAHAERCRGSRAALVFDVLARRRRP